MPVEQFIFQQNMGKSLWRIIYADVSQGTRGALISAFATVQAHRAVNPAGIRQACVVFTNVHAITALDTSLARKRDFRVAVLSLGVLAKGTSQGTSLEEHNAADTGAIFMAVPFDICDKRRPVH